MRFFKPCFVAGWLYPDARFRIKTSEKIICLTFDDGPDPESTPKLLEILKKYNIGAIFFCNGRAAERNPGIMGMIKSEGHLIGNHGYNHLNGWITSSKLYVSDIERAAGFTSSDLFRPPYGRLSPGQYRKLREKYKIVFWDVMPYDFDSGYGAGNSLVILRKKIRPGSIIVLHDSPASNMLKYIEEFIFFSKSEGYRFDNNV
jgi:peptidoglycan/xylan/chitin deacetylase (PgdA/CDA1 family)